MTQKVEADTLSALYEAVCGPNNQLSMQREIARIIARQDAFEAQFKILFKAAAFIVTVLGVIVGVWRAFKGGQ